MSVGTQYPSRILRFVSYNHVQYQAVCRTHPGYLAAHVHTCVPSRRSLLLRDAGITPGLRTSPGGGRAIHRDRVGRLVIRPKSYCPPSRLLTPTQRVRPALARLELYDELTNFSAACADNIAVNILLLEDKVRPDAKAGPAAKSGVRIGEAIVLQTSSDSDDDVKDTISRPLQKHGTRSAQRVLAVFACVNTDCWCLTSETGLVAGYCCIECAEGTPCQAGKDMILHVKPSKLDPKVNSKIYDVDDAQLVAVLNALANNSASNFHLKMTEKHLLNLQAKMLEPFSVEVEISQHKGASRKRDRDSVGVASDVGSVHNGAELMLSLQATTKGVAVPASVAGTGAGLQWQRSSFASKDEMLAAMAAAGHVPDEIPQEVTVVPDNGQVLIPTASAVPALPDEVTMHTHVALQAKLRDSVQFCTSILEATDAAPAVSQAEMEPVTSCLAVVLSMLNGLRQSKSHDRFDKVITPSARKSINSLFKTLVGVEKAFIAAKHESWDMTAALLVADSLVTDFIDLVTHRRFAWDSWLSTPSLLIKGTVMQELMNTITHCAVSIRLRLDTICIIGVQGCGKSTTIARLRVLLAHITTISENLDGFKVMLDEYLTKVKATAADDRKTGNYSVEVRELATRLQGLIFKAHEEHEGPSLRERSPICGWIFSLTLVKQGLMSVAQFNTVCWDIATHGYMPAGIILLRETPITCKQRAMARTGRAAEGASPIEYFTDLVDGHEMFVSIPEVQKRLRFFWAKQAPSTTMGNEELMALWGGPISKFIDEGKMATNATQ